MAVEQWRPGVCFLPALAVLAGWALLPAAQQSDSDASSRKSRNGRIGLGVAAVETLPAPVAGAQPAGAVESNPAVHKTEQTGQPQERKGELIFAPVPVSSEAIGIGVAPVAAYVFFPSSSDRVSPPSVLAMAGLYTSTRTYALGLAGMFNLKQDHYRFTFLLGAARARYQFFGIGSAAGREGEPVWLSQYGHALFLEGLRRLKWNIFAGPRFSQRQIKAASESIVEDIVPGHSPLPSIQDELNLAITSAAFGMRIQRDTRDDLFYPRRGSRIDGRADFFGPYAGSTFSFQAYQFEVNKYLQVSQRHVVALRGMGCGVTGDRIPFFELCQFGMMGDLRGYQAGRYRERTMFAMQAEWRWELWKRLGTAVFGGAGAVAPSWGSYSAQDLLPSGGLGLRYNLSKQRRINLRVDSAFSRTGASWSMGIGEVF